MDRLVPTQVLSCFTNGSAGASFVANDMYLRRPIIR